MLAPMIYHCGDVPVPGCCLFFLHFVCLAPYCFQEKATRYSGLTMKKARLGYLWRLVPFLRGVGWELRSVKQKFTATTLCVYILYCWYASKINGWESTGDDIMKIQCMAMYIPSLPSGKNMKPSGWAGLLRRNPLLENHPLQCLRKW